MQAINVAILNAWFALGFVGALLFTLVAAALQLAAPDRAALPWIIAALILYLATLVITRRVNIPLNNQLAAAHAEETRTDHAAAAQASSGAGTAGTTSAPSPARPRSPAWSSHWPWVDGGLSRNGRDVSRAAARRGEKPGTWRITRAVARDRVVSVVDPESRHAHKSRASYRDGYKAHIAAEPETGLITANTVTPGNTGDGEVAAELLAEEDEPVEVLGNAAYGGGQTRADLAAAGHRATIKPLPLRPGCPAGSTATTSPSTTTRAP